MTVRTLAIVGAKFRPPAAGLLAILPTHTALVLRREPGNLYDSNAIQVLVARETFYGLTNAQLARLLVSIACFGYTGRDVDATAEWHLGYVPRTEAAILAPELDRAGVRELAGELTFNASGTPGVRADFPG